MQIGLDVSSLTYRRGVSRYTSNLLTALARLSDVNLVLYGYSGRGYQLLERELKRILINTTPDKYDLVLKRRPPKLQALLWQTGLRSLKKDLPQIEVFHSWDYLQPPDKSIPLVSTIHDLSLLKYPKLANPKLLAAHQRSWAILKQRRAQIIAVSQATKQDILDLLKIPERLITVIPEALPSESQATQQRISDNQELRAKLKNKLRLDQPYILFVGSREPRKNLERLIKAWQPIAADYQLLVAGEEAGDSSQHLAGPAPRFLGKVSDLELATLYYYAKLLAYPSLDEGFGLPILEAFSFGLPVLSSDLPVIKEVTGNAAYLVNPQNIKAINQGLNDLLKEDKAAREQRQQRMTIRLQLFNWTKTARLTYQVYHQAIKDHHGRA